MAHALRDTEPVDRPPSVEPRKAIAPIQREAKALRAWGLDPMPTPRVAEPSAARSEVKPLGMVCEPMS